MVSDACVECTIDNCGDCEDDAADCVTCKNGYGLTDTDPKTCLACAEGCRRCYSKCDRGCYECYDSSKSVTSCGCATNETFDAVTGNCNANPSADTSSSGDEASANILKFAVIVLIALLALL